MAHSARHRGCVRDAGDHGLDRRASSTLRRATHCRTRLLGQGIDRGPRASPADAQPHRLAHFFATLTAAQRVRLADKYPLVVGNLNGAPITLRYRANRLALVQAGKVEEQRAHDSRLSPEGRAEAVRRLDRFRSMLGRDRHFLAFDPSGRGHAAEVFGDLDRAERVSVVVPGVDTNLLTLERTGTKTNAAPVGMAKSLYAASGPRAPAYAPP